MPPERSTAARAVALNRSRLLELLLAAVLFALALAPRVIGLADFLTTDEAYHWIGRVERFSAAVMKGRWADTWQTGHPGVTQMWLGTLGQWLERSILEVSPPDVPARLAHLARLRLPSALLQALLVPAIYLLLKRLVSSGTALLAALLIATSPYLIAHARLLHLDAPLTGFVTLALLCLLVASRPPWRLPWVVASGIAGGLALLTKGPSLLLLPAVGAIIFFELATGRFIERVFRALRLYLVWVGVAGLVVVAGWPAMWVEPAHAVASFVDEIVDNRARPNGDGQFFLGRAVADPGPLFYPFADLLRTTPVALAGLLALPLAFVRRYAVPHERRTLLVLLGFVLYWTAVMSLGAKKFDRYVLPTWPALMVLAAAGLHSLIRLAGGRSDHDRAAIRRLAAGALGAVILLFSLQPLVTHHPYYLSYYNPLLGGGTTAQKTLLIGWGEGMDQVGAFLRSRPDIDAGPVLSALPPTLQPFVPAPVQLVEELGQGSANYAVVYLESLQRNANPTVYAAIQQTIPLHSVTIDGIHYASIYQLPKPFERAVPARFGDALWLRGITLRRAPDSITVTPSWDVRGKPDRDYMLFLHLFDANGQRVGQIDVPVGGSDYPTTSAWQPGQQIAVPLPLPLPGGLPTGDYRLVMGLYQLRSGQRLPLREGPRADPALAGADALLLDTVRLP